MTDHVFESPYEGYEKILSHILADGDVVSSRAGKTFELENYSCLFLNSAHAVQPKRPGFSPLLGCMEGVQLIGEFSTPVIMDSVWPKYAEYTDHYGDYGERLAYGSQVEYVLRTLTESPDSRRAIMVLWNGLMDTDPGHLDHPCTLTIAFRIRKDKLNMSVTMRSNDIWRGASSDFIQFAMLHQTMAALLDVSPGTYHHTAQSMHLYSNDLTVATEWLSRTHKDEQYENLNIVKPIYRRGWDYVNVQNECRRIMSTGTHPDSTETDMGYQIAAARFARQRKILGEQ